MMRKNRMMRAASALSIAVLLSTSMISGTFAKYTTQSSGGDSARVAKWGVTAGISGNLFSNSYKDNPTTFNASENGRDITVQAEAEGTKVVAPGTQNDTGITFTLQGTPEVDTKVEVVFDKAQDIMLKAGTYPDPTNTSVDFTLTNEYHPIVFTLKDKSGTTLVSGDLNKIKTYLTDSSSPFNQTYEANKDLSKITGDTNDGTYTLTWKWPFDGNDKADTYLGNLIATSSTSTDAVTTIELGIKLTVTQVD